MAGMKSLKKRRRVQVIVVAVLALALSTGLIGFAMRDGINFFRSPSQVMSEPPTASEVFRLGGMVEEGSLVRGQGEEVTFRVTDFCQSVDVSYRGILPDLFNRSLQPLKLIQNRFNGPAYPIHLGDNCRPCCSDCFRIRQKTCR